MFLRKNWLPFSVFLIAIVGVGLYYLQTQQTPKEPIIIYKAVEVETKPKPPPPGETYETGHWHGDEWHKGSHDAHAPAEVSKPQPPPQLAEHTPVVPPTPPETAPLDLKALEGPMMARYKRFKEVAKTIDSNYMEDVIEASGLVKLSQAELRAMSGEELLALQQEAYEKQVEIFPEYQRRMERVINGASMPKEYIESIRYELAFRRMPGTLASNELERRYETSFERLPPDQRFLTIHPQVAERLQKLLDERYERKQKEQNR